jgi:hypothetical protein
VISDNGSMSTLAMAMNVTVTIAGVSWTIDLFRRTKVSEHKCALHGLYSTNAPTKIKSNSKVKHNHSYKT